MGTVKGCGVTTMAVAIANYLSGIIRKDVSVYEHNCNRTFVKMNEYFNGVEVAKYKGCTYYSKGAVKLSALYNEENNIVVIDFGTDKLNINEFNRCDYRIVMGSLEPWNLKVYSDFDNISKDFGGSNKWLMIFNGDIKTIKRFQKEIGMHIKKRPFIDNPFIIDIDLVEFFETLFFRKVQ